MKKYSKSQQFWGLIAISAITFVGAGIGALASVDAAAFYEQLARPVWAPPAGVFGPVWSVLYGLMAVAAWLVWRRLNDGNPRAAYVLYAIQLALNAMWSWLFFAWHLGLFALIDIALLWGLIGATIRVFWGISRPAGIFLLPYWAWVNFAAALNYEVWRMNPGFLGA